MIGLTQQTAAPAATEAVPGTAPGTGPGTGSATAPDSAPAIGIDTATPGQDAPGHATDADAVNQQSGAAVSADGQTTATTAAEGGASVGMPQLDPSTYANQIFWLALTLILIWWVLSRIALPRIGGVLADRQNAVSGDLGAAEEFKRKARDAEAAYERALAEARTEAQGIVAEQKAAIQAEVDKAVAHADAEIAARASESEARIADIRASSLSDARSVARDVTAEIVKVFGGQADDAAITAAVDRRLQGAAQ